MTRGVAVASSEDPARTRARLLAFDRDAGGETLPASLRSRGYEFATVMARGDRLEVTLGPMGRGLGCALDARINPRGTGAAVEGRVRESDFSRRIGLVTLLALGGFATWMCLQTSHESTWNTVSPLVFFVLVVILRSCFVRLVCALQAPDFRTFVEYAVHAHPPAA
jgi:hypothetical protein